MIIRYYDYLHITTANLKNYYFWWMKQILKYTCNYQISKNIKTSLEIYFFFFSVIVNYYDFFFGILKPLVVKYSTRVPICE